MNSLGTIFRLSKNPDPSKDPEVVLALKRMHRRIGRHQKQATPLTHNHLERLLSNCPDDLKGMRNRVLLQLGYETMRRRSELCAFRFEDLEIRNDARPILQLRKSKTDQESIGRAIPISTALGELIEMWREISRLCDPLPTTVRLCKPRLVTQGLSASSDKTHPKRAATNLH